MGLKFMFMVTKAWSIPSHQWLKQHTHSRDQTIDPRHNVSQSFKGMGFIVIYPIPIKVMPHSYGCCFMFTHLAIVITAINPSNPCHFYIILLTLQHSTFYLPTYILMYIHWNYMMYIYIVYTCIIIYYLYIHVNVHYFSSHNSCTHEVSTYDVLHSYQPWYWPDFSMGIPGS